MPSLPVPALAALLFFVPTFGPLLAVLLGSEQACFTGWNVIHCLGPGRFSVPSVILGCSALVIGLAVHARRSHRGRLA